MKFLYVIPIMIIIIQLTGCGGATMLGTVVDKNGNAIPNVDVDVKSVKSGKSVFSKLTDNNGTFRVNDLDKHDKYKINVSKKTLGIDMLKTYIGKDKEYKLSDMSKEQIKSIKIKPDLIAGIKGKVIGPELIEQEQESVEMTDSAEESEKVDIQKPVANRKNVPIVGATVSLMLVQESTDSQITDIKPVYIQKHEAITDPEGNFEIRNIDFDGKYILHIIDMNYQYQYKDVPEQDKYYELKTGTLWDIGEIILELPPSEGPGEIDSGSKILQPIDIRPIHNK